MAIIKCPECGHQISDRAPICPNCGVEIAGNIIKCNDCGEVFLKDEELCPHCHCPAPGDYAAVKDSVRQEEPVAAPVASSVSPAEPKENNRAEAKSSGEIRNKKTEAAPKPAVTKEETKQPKKTSKTAFFISFLIALVIFGACFYMYNEAQQKKENEEFNFAVNSNDPLVLQGFLDTYKDATQAHRDTIQAKLKMIKLGNQEWTNALVSNSKSVLQEYLKNYPNSEHKALAMHKIDSIDWAQTSSLDTEEAYTAYITEHPDGDHRDEADEFIKKIKAQTVSPEEKSFISDLFHNFFISINSRNEDNLKATVAETLTLLNKENATKSDVVEMMNKLYKEGVTEMTWKLPGNYNIKKREAGEDQYEYIVSFSANQEVVSNDASLNGINKYRIDAEVNTNKKIALFKMTKIVE